MFIEIDGTPDYVAKFGQDHFDNFNFLLKTKMRSADESATTLNALSSSIFGDEELPDLLEIRKVPP
jgi:hypothetical protein